MEDNNKRIIPALHPSQAENSQAEKISLRAFLSRREAKGTDEATSRVTLLAELRLGEGSTEIDNLQAKINAQEPPLPSPSRADLRTDGSPDSEKIEHSVRKHKCETLRAWSKTKTGMSEAKVEQQSTETLSFRCWCERCRLTRGRRVKQKRTAFTLAEVLITLGIIGVVAALTLPALLTNIQSKVRAERSRSVQYKFSLATEKMARLNLIGPYDSTDAFVDELQKHLKISKRCNASNLRGCWPYDTVDLGNGKTWDISKTKTGKQFGMNTDDDNDYTSDNVGIVTADGTPMILSYNKKCKAIDSLEKLSWSTTDNKPLTNPSASCVAAVYEINVTGKPNKLSDDVVLFNANKLGSGCAFEVGSTCYTAVFSPKPLTYDECMAQKDNLGIKQCCPTSYCNNTDYWAGAVKQCGGVSKMPTMDDLGKLASQLYKGKPSIGAKQDISGLQWDQDAATALGFTSPNFYLWSGEEIDSDIAYGRSFSSTGSNWNGNSRDLSDRQAVCLGE